MLLVPARTPVARPDAVIVATAVLELAHVAVAVRSLLLPSLNVPVAENGCVWPSSIEALAGATEMEIKLGGGFDPDTGPTPEMPSQVPPWLD